MQGHVYEEKGLKQAPPFPAEVVRALEEYALHAESKVDSLFTNFILFCIFSSCRIGDATKIREVEFSRCHDIFLVEAATSEAKNTNTMERRRMLLPFTAIGWCLHPNPWRIKWQMQLEAMKPETIMPAFSEVSGQFLKRHITTAEACGLGRFWYVRALLQCKLQSAVRTAAKQPYLRGLASLVVSQWMSDGC